MLNFRAKYNCQSSYSRTLFNVLNRYTLDVISSCAFGLELHSQKNPNSEFLKAGNKVFASRFWASLSVVWPYLTHVILRVPRFPPETCKFYDNVVRDALQQRREKKIFRNDFLNLLTCLGDEKKLRNFAKNCDRCDITKAGAKFSQSLFPRSKNIVIIPRPIFFFLLLKTDFDTNFISAQCILFFTAGYETTSNTLSFALFELAQNPKIQKKAQTEIDEILEKRDGRVTYELLKEFRYVDQIVDGNF